MKKTSFDTSSLANDQETRSLFEVEIDSVLLYRDTFERLKNSLKGFDNQLAIGLQKNEFIDLELAKRLFVTASALLQICEKSPSAEFVPYTFAAISYFVRSDDSKDDFADIEGFEDDRRVLELVIEKFSLQSQVDREILVISNKKENKSA